MKYIKQSIVVEARECEAEETVVTLNGPVKARPGDFIITDIAGREYPCDRAVFEATHKPAYTAAPDQEPDSESPLAVYLDWKAEQRSIDTWNRRSIASDLPDPEPESYRMTPEKIQHVIKSIKTSMLLGLPDEARAGVFTDLDALAAQALRAAG